MGSQESGKRHPDGETVTLSAREWNGLRRMSSAFTVEHLGQPIALVLSDGSEVSGVLGGVGPEDIRVSDPNGGYNIYFWDDIDVLEVDAGQSE